MIPDAKFAAHAVTAPWNERSEGKWPEFNRIVLRELGPELSYISFHPYYRGMPPSAIAPYIESLRQDIAACPNPKIRIFISEHGKWPPGKRAELETELVSDPCADRLPRHGRMDHLRLSRRRSRR